MAETLPDVVKRVAASHLDLETDVDSVEEMVAGMLTSGSNKDDLKVYGSPEAPERAIRKITKLFSQIELSLDGSDLQFDIRTGEFSSPDDTQLAKNEAAFERLQRDLEVRLEYQIGHVLRYLSPNL